MTVLELLIKVEQLKARYYLLDRKLHGLDHSEPYWERKMNDVYRSMNDVNLQLADLEPKKNKIFAMAVEDLI